MKGFRSIRWRLLLWHGLLLALILSCLGFTAYRFEDIRREKTQTAELQRHLGLVANSIRPIRPSGPPEAENRPRQKSLRLPPAEVASFEDQGEFYYVVWLKNGDPVTRSPHAPAEVPRPGDEESGDRRRGPWREIFLSPAPGDCVLVGRSIAQDQTALRRLAWLLAVDGLALLGFSLLVDWGLVTHALRPIRAISVTAAKITRGDLSQRIPTGETESELGELVGVLNSTFDQLEATFAQQVRFTGDAAHELRTPVSVILTHAQNGLASGGLSEAQREAFEACQRAAQRMRRLIESLLQLARFDAGQESIRRQKSDLALVAKESVELIRPLAAARSITLKTDLVPVEIAMDHDQIAQVLTNLLSNAIDYNQEGGEVRLRLRRVQDEVICSIEDNGLGISSEHLPHIFERFYRVDAARTGAGHAGLGLAISQSIVKAHGGQIKVESRPGEGSTFSIYLPT
jgi:heavy metal sensor kinase